MSSTSEFNQFMDEYYPDIKTQERHKIQIGAIMSNDPKSKVQQSDKR